VAIKCVAERLGNTPAVCRKCYVHPAVLECYMSGAMARLFRKRARQNPEQLKNELRSEEESLMRLLRNGAKNGNKNGHKNGRKTS